MATIIYKHDKVSIKDKQITHKIGCILIFYASICFTIWNGRDDQYLNLVSDYYYNFFGSRDNILNRVKGKWNVMGVDLKVTTQNKNTGTIALLPFVFQKTAINSQVCPQNVYKNVGIALLPFIFWQRNITF